MICILISLSQFLLSHVISLRSVNVLYTNNMWMDMEKHRNVCGFARRWIKEKSTASSSAFIPRISRRPSWFWRVWKVDV